MQHSYIDLWWISSNRSNPRPPPASTPAGGGGLSLQAYAAQAQVEHLRLLIIHAHNGYLACTPVVRKRDVAFGAKVFRGAL